MFLSFLLAFIMNDDMMKADFRFLEPYWNKGRHCKL